MKTTNTEVLQGIDASGLPVFVFDRLVNRRTGLVETVVQTDCRRIDAVCCSTIQSTIYRNSIDRKGNINPACKNDFVSRIRLYGYVCRRNIRNMYFNYEFGNTGLKKVGRAMRDNINRYNLDHDSDKEWFKKVQGIFKDQIGIHSKQLDGDYAVYTACLKNKNGNNEIGIHAAGMIITNGQRDTVLCEVIAIGDIFTISAVVTDRELEVVQVKNKRGRKISKELINGHAYYSINLSRSAPENDCLDFDMAL